MVVAVTAAAAAAAAVLGGCGCAGVGLMAVKIPHYILCHKRIRTDSVCSQPGMNSRYLRLRVARWRVAQFAHKLCWA
jgi:hypothetical protein